MKNKTRVLTSVLALAIAASATASLSGCGSQNKPEGVVMSFMSALDKGQAEEALSLSGMSVPSGADTALLTDAVYAAATDRPTGAKVTSVQSSDDSHATVAIAYTLAGKPLSATFAVTLMTPETGKSKVWQIDPQPFGDAFAAGYGDLTGSARLALDPWYTDGELTVDGETIHLPASASGNVTELVFPGTYTFAVASTALLPPLSATWSTDTTANQLHSPKVPLARSLGDTATAAVTTAYLKAFNDCVATQPQVENTFTPDDAIPNAGTADGGCPFLQKITAQVETDVQHMQLGYNQSTFVDGHHICVVVPHYALSDIAYQVTTPPGDFTVTTEEDGSGYSVTPSSGNILVTATITMAYAPSQYSINDYSNCTQAALPAGQQAGFSRTYDAAPPATYTTDGTTVTVSPF